MRSRLDRAIAELTEEFHGIFSTNTINRFVEESYVMLTSEKRNVTGPNFIGLIVDRFARDRLYALAHAEGRVEKDRPEVLYVCVHNAGRSQIAAALTRHMSDAWISVRSAGSQPGEQVHPLVVRAMEEIGIDVTQAFPKPLTDEVVRAADIVVTMGCGDACPIYPGTHYEDWEIADPSGMDIEGVRAVREEIRERVKSVLARVAPAVHA
jgi:protein-tyrosine-phosphatase